MTEQLYSPERRPDLDNLFEYFTTRMTRAMHVCLWALWPV
jgi:hypothetical protein